MVTRQRLDDWLLIGRSPLVYFEHMTHNYVYPERCPKRQGNNSLPSISAFIPVPFALFQVNEMLNHM